MTDNRPEPPVPDPHTDPRYSEPGLPPNPTVGELVTEIDRARTGAARAAGELLEKVDVRRRIRDTTKDRVATTRELMRRNGPGLAGLLAALAGLLWWRRRGKRRGARGD